MNKITKIGLTFLLAFFTIFTIHAQDIQRVRIDFETPDGCSRQLLLGFTQNNAATDGFDYGYDAATPDILPNDLNWLIENGRYVIQGVGAFEDTKVYPLGLFVTIQGTIKIALNSLENFNEEIDVYIYDSLENSYTKINDNYFENVTAAGEFHNRFSIAFKGPNLATDELVENEFDIKYLRNSNELFFSAHLANDIEHLTIYNIFGQRVLQQSLVKSNRFELNLNSNKSNVFIVHLKTTKGIISKKIII